MMKPLKNIVLALSFMATPFAARSAGIPFDVVVPSVAKEACTFSSWSAFPDAVTGELTFYFQQYQCASLHPFLRAPNYTADSAFFYPYNNDLAGCMEPRIFYTVDTGWEIRVSPGCLSRENGELDTDGDGIPDYNDPEITVAAIGGSCYQNINGHVQIAGATYTGSYSCAATGRIVTGKLVSVGNATTGASAQVVFNGAEGVLLGPGFHVLPGSTFSASSGSATPPPPP